MTKSLTANVLLSLLSIKSDFDVPYHYNVIFELKNPISNTNLYVAFTFNSFDLMYVYLKSLARHFKICSIDNLYKADHPVKIEYTEDNSHTTFKYLILDDGNIWPSTKIHGYFL